jgi:hypothetical protein
MIKKDDERTIPRMSYGRSLKRTISRPLKTCNILQETFFLVLCRKCWKQRWIRTWVTKNTVRVLTMGSLHLDHS